MNQLITFIGETSQLDKADLNQLWMVHLEGDRIAYTKLKYHYMKLLLRIRPLYSHLNDEEFYSLLESAVSKALDRSMKFHITDYNAYMDKASQTYFKHLLLPDSDTLHIPIELLKVYAKLQEIFNLIPILEHKDDESKIILLSKGFHYPIFSTRLLYYSFMKWKNNQLRQVDIDLTVNLLPSPQRVKWEIFHELDPKEIKKKIEKELGVQ